MALLRYLAVFPLLVGPNVFLVGYEVVLASPTSPGYVALGRTVLRRDLGPESIHSSATWSIRGGDDRLGRVLAQLLEALAAAHRVPAEPELLQVSFLLEARRVHTLPVLFLDDECRSVSARQARDHTRVEKLLCR